MLPKPLAVKTPPAGSPPSEQGLSPFPQLNISKNYVVPPRPKPGRKPSTEPQSNRRKSQNRDAQRAFRERRSTAVRELEDILAQQALEATQAQAKLQAQIEELRRENQELRTNGSPSAVAYSTPQSPAVVGDSPAALELLDHVLDQKLPVFKKPTSPSMISPRTSKASTSPAVTRQSPPASGLQLTETSWVQPAVPLRRRSSSLEVDFTQSFRPQSLKRMKTLELTDRCGFCSDGFPCICAQAAEEKERGDVADVTTLGGQPLPSQEKQDVCTGNPLNCDQCRDDPMLTLFCSTVSAKPVSHPAEGIFIPAQAAYRTLTRHPNFARADVGDVVAVLGVRSNQIEVNSLARLLRELDKNTK